MSSKNYILYHAHSDYSLLDSCTDFKDYVDLAVKNNQPAIAFTEHGKPMGWIAKKMYCDKQGVKYIHGVEIYLTESLVDKVRDNYHTVLLAKNWDGVKEINRLVSRSCDKDHFYYTNRISFDEFLALSDNVITTSACLASPLNKLPDDHPRYMELAKKYTFLEIQPHNHPEQIEFNRRLVELSKKIGTPLIAGTDTHSSSDYKAQCRLVLTAAHKKSYGDEDAFDLTYKTYDQLVSAFRRQNAIDTECYLKAIDNTNLLYDLVSDFELDTSIKYPILYSSREEDSKRFTELVEERFKQKLNDGIIPASQAEAFRAAIDEEMSVFRKLKMDGFMLSMSELITWCKQQDMAIGTARGSVGGSRVAYVADIIDLNPETWHTVFSRFCNSDRNEIGDIDIDCVDSDRPAIFEHIISRFGADKTARVASFGTVVSKGVMDDIGRYFRTKYEKDHPGAMGENPYSIANVSKIKKAFEADEKSARSKYPDFFYYYDGMLGTKVSQSVHPAGIVISPVTLDDNYGVFEKDGVNCLMLDMEDAHEVGLAKYDFLALKTVQVIRDTCRALGTSYPKSHEINWGDEDVWASMIKSPYGVFQFESPFAFDSLKKYQPKSLFDMSLVTAAIRPSGASYRDALLAKIPNKNPSEIIDNLLADNNGYLVYQEDVIKFLQQICGLSGSAADNVRRSIARKQIDRLQKALPQILDGYCRLSPKPREEAEAEAHEFIQIIEDASSYMFGYNHSIAYCMLGYICAYYRHYHPYEFITSFLNNAANDDDIKNGTSLARIYGIKITMPKWGVSRRDYYFDKEKGVIAKGISSIKFMGDAIADELYDLSQRKRYLYFMDLLVDLENETSLDSRQLTNLIHIDYFSDFGNQRELLRIVDMFDMFKQGTAKQIRRSMVDGTPLEPIVTKYADGKTKSGDEAKSYKLLNVPAILQEVEDHILAMNMDDLSDLIKVQNFKDVMGYSGYTSGKEEDRRKLYVDGVYPLFRKRDGKHFGYSIITKSIGSGKDSRFTVFNRLYNNDPIKEGDIIYCSGYTRDGPYFELTAYHHCYS